MNKSMILELADNATCYTEKIKLFKIEEYSKNFDEFEKICEKLCEGMSEKEKYDIMWDLNSAQGAMESVVSDEFFKEGFKLGLIIGAQNFLD